ncbi:hypothetical protein Ahy_A08g038974 isoform G [Arachis hypogaea]|uniref:Uncharacterized protein n=1 Tax=Arachis hypogaea TaxID=3818 RepID=A0A445BVC8_ARAHY|nr:hypothetical protein Ahy_A08g038974 isoform G [Arachis hypogaea]
MPFLEMAKGLKKRKLLNRLTGIQRAPSYGNNPFLQDLEKQLNKIEPHRSAYKYLFELVGALKRGCNKGDCEQGPCVSIEKQNQETKG